MIAMSEVELVYIPINGKPIHVRLAYLPDMTVFAVILQSALTEIYPEIASLPVGIFSKTVSRDTIVKPGDRIEFYRPLLIDPKEKRRQRAQI